MKQANTTTPTAAQKLAEWALSVKVGSIAPDVLERVKLHVLDQLGAQVACRNLPTPVLSRDFVTKYGREGKSSLIGTSLKVDAESAGFSNGTAGHSFEIDDYSYGAFTHPGCVVVPPAFAVGEETGATGEQVLAAIAVGFEATTRIALASQPSLLLDRGFHESSTHGAFASALTCCKLEGDDLETTINAIAIAGSHASGTVEYARSGGEVKRVHAGIGVANGIRSARLARMGLTGPWTIFEGKRGFLQAFCNTHDETMIHGDIATRWRFPEHAAIKVSAAVGRLHAPFAAYDKIVAEHKFRPEDIETIVLGVDPVARVHGGSMGPRPKDMVGAQFSAEFSIAMRVLGGKNDFAAYQALRETGFEDPAILAIADRVRLELDDESVRLFPKDSLARVTITLKNGKVLTAAGYGLGSPRNPLGRAGIEAKYANLVGPELGAKVARETTELVMNLEKLADVRELTRLLSGA